MWELVGNSLWLDYVFRALRLVWVWKDKEGGSLKFICKIWITFAINQINMQSSPPKTEHFNTIKEENFITTMFTSNLMYHIRYLQSPKVSSQYSKVKTTFQSCLYCACPCSSCFQFNSLAHYFQRRNFPFKPFLCQVVIRRKIVMHWKHWKVSAIFSNPNKANYVSLIFRNSFSQHTYQILHRSMQFGRRFLKQR